LTLLPLLLLLLLFPLATLFMLLPLFPTFRLLTPCPLFTDSLATLLVSPELIPLFVLSSVLLLLPALRETLVVETSRPDTLLLRDVDSELFPELLLVEYAFEEDLPEL
jgi:hypothetical protein